MSWFSEVAHGGSSSSGLGFTGTATGNVYVVGQKYVSAGRVYTAQADGTFVRDDGHRTVGSSVGLQTGQSHYVGSGSGSTYVVTQPGSGAVVTTSSGGKSTKKSKSKKSGGGSSAAPKAPVASPPIPKPRESRPGVPAGHQAPPPVKPAAPSPAPAPTRGSGAGSVTKPGGTTAGPGGKGASTAPPQGGQSQSGPRPGSGIDKAKDGQFTFPYEQSKEEPGIVIAPAFGDQPAVILFPSPVTGGQGLENRYGDDGPITWFGGLNIGLQDLSYNWNIPESGLKQRTIGPAGMAVEKAIKDMSGPEFSRQWMDRRSQSWPGKRGTGYVTGGGF